MRTSPFSCRYDKKIQKFIDLISYTIRLFINAQKSVKTFSRILSPLSVARQIFCLFSINTFQDTLISISYNFAYFTIFSAEIILNYSDFYNKTDKPAISALLLSKFIC